MRHNKKFNHLGRTASHRAAMLSNMANSLIQHKRITTTLAKAKALRIYLEPLVTKTKNDTLHARRTVFDKLQRRGMVSELFDVIGPKVADRPGGYLRILKIGRRHGDDAMMALIEFVDFNENRVKETKDSKATTSKTRRSRRSTKKTEDKVVAAPAEEVVEAPLAEDVATVEEAPVVEETSAVEEEVTVEEEKKEEEK